VTVNTKAVIKEADLQRYLPTHWEIHITRNSVSDTSAYYAFSLVNDEKNFLQASERIVLNKSVWINNTSSSTRQHADRIHKLPQ